MSLIVSGVGGVSFFIAQIGMDDTSICWNMLPVMIGLEITQAQLILLLDVKFGSNPVGLFVDDC